MPASIFNGAISFGLVSVPITVLSATEDHAARFRQIHTADHGLVRNHHWCEAEDREVTFAEIGRGCELPDGRVVPVTDEELRALPLPKARAIELIAFVPAAVVPPPVTLGEDEIDEAMALIEAMTRDDLTGPEFTDRYTEVLHAVIEAKQEDRPPPEAPEPTALPGQLVEPDGHAAGVGPQGPGGARRDGCAQGAGQAREEGTLPKGFLKEPRAHGRSARYASALACCGRGHGVSATVVGPAWEVGCVTWVPAPDVRGCVMWMPDPRRAAWGGRSLSARPTPRRQSVRRSLSPSRTTQYG
ncbi:Ku protein [Streptomyces mirabilis]|uniref:Ku protein n=1 Tax=Streptomyces mirabilis TaxID=68239 RepID=UPI002E3444D3|nr:Ku protein [Streptomyces mirabilis]